MQSWWQQCRALVQRVLLTVALPDKVGTNVNSLLACVLTRHCLCCALCRGETSPCLPRLWGK
jgi:hypothetical protein